jgi:hypothetical protein
MVECSVGLAKASAGTQADFELAMWRSTFSTNFFWTVCKTGWHPRMFFDDLRKLEKRTEALGK